MKVTSLHVYPVKAMRGSSVASFTLDSEGPLHDRQFMLVGASNEALTTRAWPHLTLLRSRVEGSQLEIEFPDREPARVSLALSGERLKARTEMGDELEVVEPAPEVSRAIAAWLGTDARLVTRAEGVVRPPTMGVRADFNLNLSGFGQFLITTEASLDDLNGRMDAPVSMDRFRPNIVADGAPAWTEDRWRRVRIGDQEFVSLSPCQRCAVIGVDPETGERMKEPLRTLSTFRKWEKPIPGVYFGLEVYRPSRDPGELAVGDSVEVVR